jgi:hypothetical protein
MWKGSNPYVLFIDLLILSFDITFLRFYVLNFWNNFLFFDVKKTKVMHFQTGVSRNHNETLRTNVRYYLLALKALEANVIFVFKAIKK